MSNPLRNLQTILVFSIACWGLPLFAQKPNSYEVVSIAQGLSQGMVFDILQDKEGFIWVATKNGLNRYDGYGFKVFTNDPYNAHSLSSNTVVSIFEDSKGRIWAGTDNAGLNVYDKKSGQFYRFMHDAANSNSLSGNTIIGSITELEDGRILAPAQDAGLNIIQLPTDFFEQEAVLPVITRVALPGNTSVYGIGKDPLQNIWVACLDKNIYHFNPAGKTFSKLSDGKFYNSGYATADGGLWINGHFFLWDGKSITPLFDTTAIAAGNLIFNPKFDPWINFHEEPSYYDICKWQPGQPLQWGKDLPLTAASKVLYPFVMDRSGMLWAGTKGYGLRKYNTAEKKFSQRAAGFSVRFIVASASNDVYLGAYPYEWKRLFKDSLQKNVFSNITADKEVDNFLIAANGDYWIRTDDNGPFKYSIRSHQLRAFPSVTLNNGQGDKQPMMEDSKGNVWFPGLGGVITRINTNTGAIDSFSINNQQKQLPQKAICTALYEDHNGIYWVGTEQGFAKLEWNNSANGTPVITWFANDPGNRNSLNYNYVSCFMDDPKAPADFLWICTKGGGLNRIEKKTGNFFHLTAKDGLPNDVVYGILKDDAGNIWGSTNKGIFCLTLFTDNKKFGFRNFTKADGLQDDEFNTGAYAKLANGQLAFGGVNGINIFDPKEILVPGFTPPVYITDLLVNNQSVLPGDKTRILRHTIEQSASITLSNLEDILTLEFSSLDFTAPGQNKYRYQMVGVDKDWLESGTRRSATYLHLPAGKYTFKVQGANSQGSWSNKIAALQITVLPPWWRSWWAYLIYAALLALGIRAWLQFMVNEARLKSQLNLEQLEAKRIKELDMVKTQLYTNITHEFRTPLTVILGMAEQVISKPGEHFNHGMQMIVRNGQSLLNLVNEMLDLSKLETGKMTLKPVNGDVISFLRYIVESFASLAESQKKQLHFLSEMDCLYLRYDPEKIRQIVSNLLSNALKFTSEKGNIYIAVNETMAPGDALKPALVIKVKDTGIGIPENQLQHIFDRFYQLDDSHTRKTGGTGIGLALTKELVKLMNGEITVKSPPTGANRGSEFTVILPLEKTMATGNETTHPEAAALQAQLPNHTTANSNYINDDQKPLILLVEDNADVVAYTASCLPDYRLAVGKDGLEGFEIAAERVPDLIITDVMMPFADGFELCRQLRNDEHTSHIPIIMLTAKADMESKMEGLQQGADVYLEKPFHRGELLIRIKKLLELRKHLQQFYLKKAGLANPALPVAIYPVEEEPAPESATEDAFVRKVREAVEAHLSDTHFTVEQLCKIVYMSHSQLHRKLDALTGCSPNKFIRMIRLNKAMELLRNPASSIGSVALDCGYNDPGYFARIFKQEQGATPQEWRENIKNKSC